MVKRSSFSLNNLCTPSSIYFIVSVIFLLILGLNNLNSSDKLCLGQYKCNVGNNTLVIVVNALYILLWTFILDLMCKNGWGDLSWFLLLLPIILSVLFYVMIFIKLA